MALYCIGFVVCIIVFCHIIGVSSYRIMTMYNAGMSVAVMLCIVVYDEKGDGILKWNPLPIVYVLVIALLPIILYMLEMFVLNMIQNHILLIDLRAYFSGRINLYETMISFYIVILEEMLYRYFAFKSGYSFLLVLSGTSLAFGLAHLPFSKFDVASKAVFGLVMGLVFYCTGNIMAAIYIHVVYNYLALRKKGNVQMYLDSK